MARFDTEYRATFVLDVPSQAARAHFGDVARIAENLESVEHAEPLGDGVLAVRMAPLAKYGVVFKGHYQCRYLAVGDDRLEWTPHGTGNVFMSGQARFVAEGPARTRVEFVQKVGVEIDLNFLVAALAKPIVTEELREQVRRYLDRTRATVGATA